MARCAIFLKQQWLIKEFRRGVGLAIDDFVVRFRRPFLDQPR